MAAGRQKGHKKRKQQGTRQHGELRRRLSQPRSDAPNLQLKDARVITGQAVARHPIVKAIVCVQENKTRYVAIRLREGCAGYSEAWQRTECVLLARTNPPCSEERYGSGSIE